MNPVIRNAVVISGLFLTVNMGLGSFLAFFNLHLENIEFTGTQIGIINGIYWSTIIFSVPFWGLLADRFGTSRILFFVLIGSILLIFCLGFMQAFPVVVIYCIFLTIFLHPTGSLTDSLAVYHVRNTKHSSFGKLRMWGAIGWALATIVVGFLALQHSLIIFWAASFFLFLMLLILLFYKKENKSDPQEKVNLSSLQQILSSRPVLYFMLLLFLIGFTVSPMNIILNLYYSEIGGDSSIVGLAFAVQSMTEIPFFFMGFYIVKRIGKERTLMLTIVVMAIRLLLYGCTGNPTYAIMIGALHGITFSLFLVSIIEIVHDQVPAHLRATGQGLIWAFYFGAGQTAGTIITGFLKDTVGMQATLKLAAISVGVILIVTALYFRYVKRNHIISN